jgi:hypothetical protein
VVFASALSWIGTFNFNANLTALKTLGITTPPYPKRGVSPFYQIIQKLQNWKELRLAKLFVQSA